MGVKQWLRAKIRDDQKHAELDERERRTEEVVASLREERIRNGFGELFQTQGFNPRNPYLRTAPRREHP